MAYNRTTWNTGDPITQERMNNIEQGIVDAHSANQTLDSTVADIKNTANTAATDVAQAKADIVALQRDAATTSQSAQQGTKAWTYVKEAMETDGDTVTLSLDGRLNNYYASIQTLTREVTDARKGKENLKGQMDDIDTRISGLSGGISSIENQLTAASLSPLYGSYKNISVRLSADETRISNNATNISNIQSEITTARGVNGTTLDARFNKIETDISDAKSSTAKDTTFTSVDARLEDIESEIVGARGNQSNIDARLDNIEGNISGVSSDKVDKTSIANNLTTTAAGYVLDARQGKTLNDTKVNYTDVKDDLVSTDTDKPLSAKQGKVLDEKISALTQTVSNNDSAMDTRVDALEENVNGAKVENGPQTLDARFDAVEGRATTLESHIHTIANELGMMDGTAIKDTNTKIDALEAHVQTMATELNMVQNGEIVDTNTRVDKLENRIDAVDGENGTIAGLTTRMGTAEDNITTLTNDLDAENTGLKARMTTVETKANNAATADDLNDLADRVSTLEDEPKSATVVIDNVTYDNDGNPSDIGTTPSSDVDYLLKKDDKYYYWRYFGPNNGWQLISGAGGGNGTSSGSFVASLEDIDAPDENTDYFVGTNSTGYLHYRFITIENKLAPVLIGVNPENIKRYNITKTQGKKKVYDETTQTWQETDEDCYYLNLYEFGYGESNAAEGIDDEIMQPLAQVELPEGGGGGSTVTTTPRVVRITPSNLTTVLNENHIYLRFFYSSVDATGETHDGSYTLRYNGGSIIDSGILVSGPYDTTVTTGVWPENPGLGFYQIDVTEYCRLGIQTFNLSVVTNGQTIPRIWNITIQELRLESDAPESQLIEVGNSIQFPYVPFGTMTKTLFVEIDGVDQPDLRQSLGGAISGSPQELTIPAQAHGAHTISIYLKAELNGQEVTTDPITRDYIWYDAEDEDAADVIIASPYRGKSITVEQYGQLDIPYTIYNRLSNTSTVNYYDGDTLLDTVTVTNSGTFSWTFETFGNKTVRIAVGETSLSFNVVVTESPVDIAQVTGAVINFDPTSLTNNSINRLPTWTYNNQTYHMTVSDNFNWANDISGGGYKEDVDGKCFVIKAGTYAEFDYKMFKQAVDNTDPENPVFTSSVFDKGAEMKITFKVAAVRDASAVWFSNVGNPSSTNQMPIGIQLSAHQGWLKTSAADAAEKQAALEGTTVSTNSYLYFPYSEEDKIELDISINKSGNSEDFIMSYEDGVPSKAYSYETSEILYHEAGNESVIRIGSPDCDVYIYKLRIYDKALNTSEILRNFIADGKTITEKVNRYNRNSIYYDSTKPEGKRFTPYKIGNAILDPEQLAKKMPDVKILMLEAPTFTKSKKTFVKSSLRCIHVEGGTVYPSRGDEDNWLFQGGYHSGQGTTSDNYGQASRNVDFLFECDGVNRPSDKVEAESNYISTLIKGVDKSVLNPTTKSWTPTVDAVVETCSGWKNDDAKVSLTATSVPNNYFNLKVNVASSENVNNALFQKRYNDFLPYISPAKARDSRVKNDMEFVPAILFIRETDTTKDENGNYTKHLEFNDTEWHFYSLGNIGDSKKTDYTRAYYPDDENEFTVEISDNNTPNSQFQSGVYMSNDERIVETSDSGINSMNYIWDITDEEWNAQRDPTEKEIDHDYRVDEEIEKYEDGTDVENNLTHYILPNGKVYVNYRHRMLSGDPFDGDHTFEFRYASCGDYRDGKIVNPKKDDSDPERAARYKQIKAQDKRNRAIIEAFYEWLITASNSEFVNELAEWCVPEALEYFYAFTHFYTMMDNRAKNTFWHFAKTGTPRQVHHPHPALLHVYTELKNGEYVPTEDTEIDSEKTYYTEYAFDLWAYDMDTAAGIDNNGELIFPYGKEDTDYRQAGVSSSGYVFNGAGSIIWRRLSQSFTSEIANIFDRVNEASCFDAASLITQFDNFQNCYPEEMWRLDIERKYIRTFTGKVYDNCKLTDADGNTKQNTRFLKEMMQGRKKYQRRQWVRDQGIYFGSKYMLSNVRNNTIEMVCYTPDAPLWNSRGYAYQENGTDRYRAFQPGDFTFYGPENNRKLYKCLVGNTDSTFDATKWAEGVTPDYQLKIVPYQDMYINVAVGNGNLRTPQRAIAGQEYTIDCTANMNETRVYIYAGSYIQALSNLAPFYIGANIFSSAARLKKLDLGTDNQTYHNTNLNSLTILPNMPILEELNIKNCDNLNTPINLSGSNNLRIVEAEGSVIPSLSLPAYTSIETLHLPSTVNILSLQSARRLTDFYIKNKATGLEDYTSLINMNITDSDYSTNINWIDIALAALPHLSTLYLQSLKNSSIGNITELEPFAEKKAEIETQYDDYGNLINKLNLSGLINVTGEWSEIEKENYETIWKNLTFNVIDDSTHKKVKHKVTYRYDGTSKELYVNDGTTAPDIYVIGLIDIPTKESTPQFNYRFGSRDDIQGEYVAYSGWKRSGDTQPLSSAPVINDDTILDAYFVGIKRQYYVRWFAKPNQLIYTIDRAIGYGEGANLEAPTIKDIHAKGYETCSIANNNGMITYSIFTGWEKLPINIDPDGSTDYFDIYGVWDEGVKSIGDIFSEITELTPLQLLTLSILTDTERATYGLDSSIDISTSLTYKLGQDNSMTKYNAHTIVSDTTAPLYLNGTTSSISTTYQPLLANSDAFTFAIDYALSDATYDSGKIYAIIASCYYSANGVRNGFGIFKNLSTGNIEVGFGDMYRYANQRVAVSNNNNATMRNIIVLRHPKDSPTLYIYSGLGTAQSMPLEQPYYSSITRSGSSEFNSGAVLNIGQLIGNNETLDTSDSVRTSWTGAKGTIYWAKYWEEDLGIGECKRIAEWPHENVTFAIAYMTRRENDAINRIRAQDNVVPVPTMYLATRNNLLHGLVIQDRHNYSTFVDNRYSWEQAEVRKLCNSRLLYSLPTALQSILCKAAAESHAVEYYTSSNPDEGGQYRMTDYRITTRDYLYAYSATNLLSGSSKYSDEDSSNSPFAWRIPNNVELYNYNASNQQWAVSSSTSDNRGQYFNLRFPGKAFGKNMRVFKITTEDSSGITSIVESIGKDIIKDGDIYIEGSTAYIYISNKEMNRLGLSSYLVGYGRFIGVPDNEATNIGGGAGRGGWLRAEDYWTRSLISNGMNYTIFSEVQTDGTVNVNNISTSSTGYKVNYIIAI